MCLGKNDTNQGCHAQAETKFPDNSLTEFQISLTTTSWSAVYTLGINVHESISNMETATYIIVQLLLILSGDIELNPGPTNLREHSVSVLQCNMRSIRNKLEHIIDNFCDFDCLSFTETHLDDTINNAEIFLTMDFSAPYRKDRTNHGGGILVYINNYLMHKRRQDLEIFWEESIWVELNNHTS